MRQSLQQRFLQLQPQARKYLLASIGLHIGAGFAIVIQAILLSRVIAGVFLQGLHQTDAIQPLLIVLGLISVRAMLTWLAEIYAQRFSSLIKCSLRQRLLDHVLALGPAFIGREQSGELVNTLAEGVESLDEYFSQYLPQKTLAAVIPLLIVAFVFPLDLLSGMVFVLTAPIIPIMLILVGLQARDHTQRQWRYLSRLSARLLDTLQGLTTLKLFGQSRQQLAKIAKLNQQFSDATLKVLTIAFVSALVLELTATLSTAIIAVQIGLRLLNGSLDFAPALTILILAPEFYLPLRQLGAKHHAGMTGRTAAERIFTLLDQTLASQPASIQTIPQNPEIQFNNVSVQYAPDRPFALKNVSLTFKFGQHTLIRGVSGSGKSTLVQLILGLIQPTEGSIRINGIALDQLNPEVWRKQIAYVSQQPTIFHGTIDENLRLAHPDATNAEIQAVLQLVHGDFINQLPNGLGTLVGERGSALSGGQRQRIALARALLKPTSILILDEPMAHLDAESARIIRRNLQAKLANSSVIEISHEDQALFTADQVLELRLEHYDG